MGYNDPCLACNILDGQKIVWNGLNDFVMDNDKNKGSFGISSDRRLRESLHAFFLSLRRTARVRQGAKYGMLAAISIACSWFALFLLDRFWETPSTARGFLSVLGWSGAVWAGWRRIRSHPGYPHLPWPARRMRPLPRYGERMLGIIEISRERETDDSAFSPRIRSRSGEEKTSSIPSTITKSSRRMLMWPPFRCSSCLPWRRRILGYPDSASMWERWIRPWDPPKDDPPLPPENRFHLLEENPPSSAFPFPKKADRP